jgi:hypothetical protein
VEPTPVPEEILYDTGLPGIVTGTPKLSDYGTIALDDIVIQPDESGNRCDHCPQDRLDAAQTTEAGLLIRRALDLRAALTMGIHITLDEVRGDEFYAMLILDDERNQLERERATAGRG